MVSIKDVAATAGVSTATVSLALNGSPLVNTETGKKIRKIADDMGYKPNPYARKLVAQKSGLIGVILPELKNVYYATLVECLNEELRAAGYGLSIAVSNNDPQTEARVFAEMQNNRMEGILLAPVNVPNPQTDYLNQTDIPVVFTTSAYENIDFPTIMSDLEAGMYALASSLVRQGKRNFLYLTGDRGVYALDLRERGFLRATSAQKTTVIRRKNPDYAEACRLVRELGNAVQQYDAILCINDLSAVGIINTLLQMGIRVPEEITVTGYDDVLFAEMSPTRLTTVRQNIPMIAKKSVETVLQYIRHGKPEHNSILPYEIVNKE